MGRGVRLLSYILGRRGTLVPGERIELPTFALQKRCSTAELTRLECTAISPARPLQEEAPRLGGEAIGQKSYAS